MASRLENGGRLRWSCTLGHRLEQFRECVRVRLWSPIDRPWNSELSFLVVSERIRAYNRFPAGYDLDREYVIRYPLQSTPSQRLKTIGEVFPTILTEQYECERFYVVHPDESGLPVVSKGEGRFPGKPLISIELERSM